MKFADERFVVLTGIYCSGAQERCDYLQSNYTKTGLPPLPPKNNRHRRACRVIDLCAFSRPALEPAFRHCAVVQTQSNVEFCVIMLIPLSLLKSPHGFLDDQIWPNLMTLIQNFNLHLANSTTELLQNIKLWKCPKQQS